MTELVECNKQLHKTLQGLWSDALTQHKLQQHPPPAPKTRDCGLDGPKPPLSTDYMSFIDLLPTPKIRDCGLDGPEPSLSANYMLFVDPPPTPKTRDCGLDGPEPLVNIIPSLLGLYRGTVGTCRNNSGPS